MTMLAARPALAQTATPSTKKAPASATPPAAPTPAAPTPAAPQEAKPAPYDGQMMRLSEVLGSVSYLRTLCGNDGDDWRGRMQRLLESDTASEPQRRERLTAAFNRGYRSFAAVHRSCTDAARQAEERYRNEGATLAAEIAARYGN
ncbi:MAG: TIGR02301 family protein [Neorhizobium sp.]|nr:TIGR02301 family protein [Neorhizobium sp.]